jgi:GTPase SAR1 family protein
MGGKPGKPKLTAEDRAKQKQALERSRNLDRNLEKEIEQDEAINKLLLLGAGESGKSTLFKQMITIYGKGFPIEERKTYTEVVRRNCISALKTLVEACEVHTSVTPANARLAALIMEMKEDAADIADFSSHNFEAVWRDPGVQATYLKRSKYQLMDSAEYFLNNLQTISAPDYIPSEQDVLRTRVRTTGIVENHFVIEATEYKMFDVGGQRSERKKWIHCFDGVTAVLFVAAISEFDQTCFEDDKTNRVQESLNLFEEICNNQWFKNTAIILFLNKRDLLEIKIANNVQVDEFFPDFPGPNTFAEVAKFFQEKFVSLNRRLNKKIYTHVTCATDTGNVQAVFNAVKDIILQKNLLGAGLV